MACPAVNAEVDLASALGPQRQANVGVGACYGQQRSVASCAAGYLQVVHRRSGMTDAQLLSATGREYH